MSKNLDQNSFLFAGNGDFIEDLYLKFLENPENVDDYWRNFFNNLDEVQSQALKSTLGASWLPRKSKVILPPEKKPETKQVKIESPSKIYNINSLIADYRAYGHLFAKLDPLSLAKQNNMIKLDLARYGLVEEDLNIEVDLNNLSLGLSKCTINQLITRLKEIYSSTVGYEVSHLASDEEKEWFYQNIEQMNIHHSLSKEQKIEALKDLIDVETFEQFIHNRFPGAKRFSVEGGESAIVALKEVIKSATHVSHAEEVLIGMAHRGRLNVLTKIMNKDYASMFSEFQGNLAHLEELNIAGDVKYHLGRSTEYVTDEGRKIHLSLTANPSHLEAVNPVVMGKVRAKQDGLGDLNREKVMSILIHGDAAFSGQGVVAESLAMSPLAAYDTGGVMHLVINNQVGFTTLPKDARAGRYSTEFAKIIQAPVIHVNGDDIEKVLMVANIAESYRNKFKKDIVIDIICYRKYGHNEGDEPMFTQPIMYSMIKNKKSCSDLYIEALEPQNIISQKEIEDYTKNRMVFLDKKLEEAKSYKPSEEEWLKGKWTGLDKKERVKQEKTTTGIKLDFIKNIGKALTTYPSEMAINSKITRLIEQKKKMFETGEGLDWSVAEALAYGSLMVEGSNIRMTGQDCKRGTFSHRHAVLFDQNTEFEYISLNHIAEKQGKLEVHNSNLSEYGVLGFEYGYSLIDPKNLTIWEAQFGDFANSAQIMIDQFIVSAEVKWLRMSGLVMLLPHGYEGQGPEHSSARLERFLQLCAEDNLQVINCSSPANFFHAIRRQIHSKYRKPLIVMSPKSLLRHRLMTSKIDEFLENTSFRTVIGEETEIVNGSDVKRVVLCSGKVFFDLYEAREKANIKNIALIRIDQYYPFPEEELANELKKYPNAEIIWCQEEPRNMGAWYFIESRLEKSIKLAGHKAARPVYIGRPESASPSAGYLKMHNAEQAKLIEQVITGV